MRSINLFGSIILLPFLFGFNIYIFAKHGIALGLLFLAIWGFIISLIFLTNKNAVEGAIKQETVPKEKNIDIEKKDIYILPKNDTNLKNKTNLSRKRLSRLENAYALFISGFLFLSIIVNNGNFIPSDKWAFQGAILGILLCILLYIPIILSKRLKGNPNKLATNSFKIIAFLIIWFGSWRMVVFGAPNQFADFSAENIVIKTQVLRKDSRRVKMFRCPKIINTKASDGFIRGEICVPKTTWQKIEEGQAVYLVGNKSNFGVLVTQITIKGFLRQ